ncbi:tripartite tricarboxylate transporter TctB family protein [Brevibacillus brevis]|uniref:Putative transport protein n=1 Tax=Brevibacillus brevis (strain 47 / JCM 6285 / NBRC 100599) TaxID=358681 RepID=C0ZEJ7_BREBN|nr:tripartite tricarboxylate transporter TctB family protein [Brevibacillus brevis]WGV57642.1 tripartite tricarboxylate transporter TctB family protein [Brevibacillus brevis]BAH44206.1 putative transport protein [Brevibacillus brevis NBRC 100599]
MNLMFDRIGSLFFALVGALFIAESQNISSSAYGSQVGPNMFPFGLGVILILLSLRLLWETYKKGVVASTSEPQSPLRYKRFLFILAATVLYVLLLEQLGYVIASFAFLLYAFTMMGSKSVLKSAIVSLLFSVGVYVIYVHLLKGTLPGLPAWLGV